MFLSVRFCVTFFPPWHNFCTAVSEKKLVESARRTKKIDKKIKILRVWNSSLSTILCKKWGKNFEQKNKNFQLSYIGRSCDFIFFIFEKNAKFFFLKSHPLSRTNYLQNACKKVVKSGFRNRFQTQKNDVFWAFFCSKNSPKKPLNTKRKWDFDPPGKPLKNRCLHLEPLIFAYFFVRSGHPRKKNVVLHRYTNTRWKQKNFGVTDPRISPH